MTPEKTLIDETVDFVSLPLFDGELGVLPDRTPLIGRLGYGELRTKQAESVQRYYVDGGFAQIRDNVVTVLTNRALTTDAIDATAAARDLEQAQEKLAHTDQEYSEKQKAVARSRATCFEFASVDVGLGPSIRLEPAQFARVDVAGKNDFAR